MNVKDALFRRKSTRAYLDKDVGQTTIDHILTIAGQSPSGANTQPWQVAVVKGQTKQRLQQQMENAFCSGVRAQMDYHYYPEQWHEPYKNRRKQCGLQLYTALQISREDKERQQKQWAANYRAFDAPVMLLFFLDSVMETGSFVDYGMFLQSIMLAAVEEGLATCPQAALGEYPKIVKQVLNYPEEFVLLCGMALGYEDKDAQVNNYRTPRESVAKFTRVFD